MSETELPFTFRPPRPRRFTTLRDTLPLPRAAFLRLAARAATTLPDAVHGTCWALDGHTSDRLFFRLPCGHVVAWPTHLDVTFEVSFGDQATEVRVHSDRPADLALYLRFIAAVRAELLCA